MPGARVRRPRARDPISGLTARGPLSNLKCPFIVTRYTTVFPPAGTTAPGVAEVNASSWVVTTADIHDGTAPPFSLAARSAIPLSRGIAEARTGEPGTANGVRSLVERTLPLPQATINRPASTATTHGSVTIPHVGLPMATRRIASHLRVRRSTRPVGCTTCLSDQLSDD